MITETVPTTTTEAPKVAKVKKASNPAPAKAATELSKAQVRILKALSKGKRLSRDGIRAICARAGFATAEKHTAWMSNPLGQNDPKARKIAEKKDGHVSLLTLGFVKMHELDIDGHKETRFEITGKGKVALANA